MPLITGTVKRIATREVNGKYGPATAYNLGVEQDGQNELTWIGAGFKSPGVREESRVTIMANQNAQGYWQCKPENIEVIGQAEAPAPAPAPAPAQPQAQAAAPAKNYGGNDRQSSITLQSAFERSINAVNGMLAAGIFKPAANSKKAQEAAQQAYIDYVEKLACKWHWAFNNPDEFVDNFVSEAGKDAIDESDEDMFGDEG